MQKKDIELLDECKRLIEAQLKWSESKQWRQRDFLNLITLIERKTQITLSLTTIKRIWKPDYMGTPQPGTLDTLAKFLGYGGWLDFAEAHQRHNSEIGTKIRKTKKNSRVKFLLVILITVAGIFFLGINAKFSSLNSSSSIASLSVRNASPISVPNTVIFKYRLDGIEADSFFIQQSWNKFRREPISVKDSIHTSTYFYPGAHRASLIADDRTVADTMLIIRTDDWIATARTGIKDNVPTNINIDKSKLTGVLSISKDQLQRNYIKMDPDLYLSYYYVNDFEGLDGDNFSLKVRVRNDSIFNVPCPTISLMILGTSDMHLIPFTIPGCIGNISLKIGEKMIKGKNNDMSLFGCNVYNWHLVEVRKKEEEYGIWLDDNLIHTVHGELSIGEIIGINVSFTGSGSLDFVELMNLRSNEIVYVDDFNAKG